MPTSSIGYRTRTHAQPDYLAIRNPAQWTQFHISGAIDLTNTILADSDAEGIYIPNLFLPVGTLLAYITAAGPAYTDLWVPYLPNITVDNGEATADGILAEPAYVERDQAGAIEGTTMNAAIIPAGTPCQVFVTKMPAYNDHTAYAGGSGSTAAVATGDLPSGFANLEAYGVDNIAGL